MGLLTVPKTEVEFGYEGHPEAVRALAMTLSDQYGDLAQLLRGCVQAAGEGRRDNIAAFVDGFMQATLGHEKPQTPVVYDGRDILTETVRQLIEKSDAPVVLVNTLVGRVPEIWRQRTLDAWLRQACVSQGCSVKQVEALVAAGGNVNAKFGTCLATTWLANASDIREAMAKHGARFGEPAYKAPKLR